MTDRQAMLNHPDANLLAAFTEHMLTPPEHTALAAHLADCARCRDIVFLVQQTAPELTEPAARPAFQIPKVFRHPLFAMSLAAVLLAAISLGWLIHFRNPRGRAEISQAQRSPFVSPPAATPPALHTPTDHVTPPQKKAAQRTSAPATVPGRVELETGSNSSAYSSALDSSSAPGFPAVPAQSAVPQSSPLAPSTANGSDSSAPTLSFQAPMHAAAIPPPQAETQTASPASLVAPPTTYSSAGGAFSSRIEIRGRILAINPSGALFASDDCGQHWRVLQSPCAGPATISLACTSGARWTSQSRGDSWQPADNKPSPPIP